MPRSSLICSTLVVVLSAFASGCTDKDAEEGRRDPPSIPEDDVAYIDELVPHHAMAISMADEVLARGSDPAVRAMAEMMKQTQQREIDTMLSVRASLTGDDDMPTMIDPHNDADMAQLSSLQGIELDRAFLRNMVPHHAGAVVTSHRALPNLRQDELRGLAESTVAAQIKEAAAMQAKLEALGD